MNIIATALRDSLHADVLEALDTTEAVYRWLDRATPTSVGLHPNEHAGVRDLPKTAYDALAKARILTDREA